ncbi:penicillin-binding transpeptidase domain-containing protein [Streptomyces sp. WMMC500]|uniref:penicillin-binding transpeptidase domain-containing protein n=1 Tax=Streptomyces sp. WMMC500 TaxID=3015154 RepID=UPI00248C9982|nr:penicillin-binding transpeptidase domain-containing protein [Streptomyces sp. WMMC500]WBB62725.1 penicillin-binding transpeptidase domain-containing protein [Streptomyces sp. WMMC500]
MDLAPPARVRSRWALVAGAVVVAAGVLAGGIAYVSGGGDGAAAEARQEVRAYTAAWARGAQEEAARHTDRPRAAADLLNSVQRGLGPQDVRVSLDDAEKGDDGTYTVPFSVRMRLPGFGTWEYETRAVALPPDDGEGGEAGEAGEGSGPAEAAGGRDGGWRVRWEPRLVHPALRRHQTLVTTTRRAERAPILAADGSELAGDAKVWAVSIWPAKLSEPDRAYAVLADPALDAGLDVPRLKKRVADAEPDESVPVVTLRDEVYRQHRDRLLGVPGLQFVDSMQPVAHLARSLVGAVAPDTGRGATALQARYDERLYAAPGGEVVVADRATGAPVRTLARKKPGAGEPVRTTIDPGVQRAAEEAVGGLGKTASIVAVDPGTGRVLAVADSPDSGESRALTGRFPPGSTFKTVTAAALLDGGLAAGDRVACPAAAHVAGQRFENQDEFDLPAGSTFAEAFAQSCNTAFVGLRDELDERTLTRTARAFGIGGTWQVGAATFDGSVPAADGANDQAAAMIGQGRVEASPLVMASVAATVKAGRFRQPVLVPDAVDKPYRAPETLDARTYEQVRALMRDVVTDGSGSALAGLPGLPHAKTGTAEFGTENPPRTHAWMIGYLEDADLAFSVLVEDGGSGGRDAGPVAAEFLRAATDAG